jgi:MoxR-like ATPase
MTMRSVHRSLLRPLGIVGYDALEPAFLAALATREPLLLVSDHGAAKSLLLLRLAEALGLDLRHYNASLLQFDDLAGFPIPDDRGAIRYAAPPGAVWGAEAVFFDEIGRCRPDVANKLFPIIHERRLQGVPLDSLQYRWAATNPPADAQGDDAPFAYNGVEPLDPALADRFAYVITLPTFAELPDADQRAIITGAGEYASATAGGVVRELVETTRALIPTVRDSAGDELAAYAQVLIARLGAAGIVVGGRRAAVMWRNFVAVRAAHLALGLTSDERACRLALSVSLPHVVCRVIPSTLLRAAHTAAWSEAGLAPDNPERVLRGVRDPLRRALLAITLPAAPLLLRGEILCAAMAELPPMHACMAAWAMLPYVLDTRRIPASAAETVATIVAGIAQRGVEVRGYSPHRQWAVNVRQRLAQSAVPAADAEFLHGVVARHATPPAQAAGTPLDTADALIAELLGVRDQCRAALGAALDAHTHRPEAA